jgi:hypothetical protein
MGLCSEDNLRIGYHGRTWNIRNLGDESTWISIK